MLRTLLRLLMAAVVLLTGIASTALAATPLRYSFAEGATGSFLTLDLCLSNPHMVEAPVTLTFLKESGETVERKLLLAPTSRVTVRVNEIPGLQATALSTVVQSDNGLPIGVERTLFLGEDTYHAAHTVNAVDGPSTTWYFGEGSQGYFDTYLLLANAGTSPADVTVTFALESGQTVSKKYAAGPTSRLTVFAGAIPELVGRSFSMTVVADRPITAERSLYFGTARFWDGAHASPGAPSLARAWYFGEGATGAYFNTYLLIGNPNGMPADVTFTYLLNTGVTIVRRHPVSPQSRLTVNVADEDPLLANAAVSTTVTSDLPIIAERSMYWPGAFPNWWEAHNSLGLTETGQRWVLAEGRVGGQYDFETYILIGNPNRTTAADVRITFLRSNGTTLVRNFIAAPTSRLNVAIPGDVPDLIDEEFGAVVEVRNGVDIIVERAMYFTSHGTTFKGGTNATASKLPSAPQVGPVSDVPARDGGFLDGDDTMGIAAAASAPERRVASVEEEFGVPAESVSLGKVPWISQKFTCPSWDDTATCGPTAAAMAAAYVKGIDVEEALVKRFVTATSGNWPCGEATTFGQLSTLLENNDVPTARRTFNAQALVQALKRKHPVLALVYTQDRVKGGIDLANKYGHYMLVVGMTPTSIIVNDPGRSTQNRQEAEAKVLPLDNFVDAWRMKSGFQGLEIGGGDSSPEPAEGDFSVQVAASAASVAQGSAAEFSVVVQGTGGFREDVALDVLHLPADQVLPGTGFAPRVVGTSALGRGVSTLTIVTNAATPPGTYTLTFRGKSSTMVRDTTAVLTVSAAATAAPSVRTLNPEPTGASGAKLSALVTPNGLATSLHFEWGTTTAYGRQTPLVQVGQGTGPVAVSALIGSLLPGVTYHVRAVAVNAAGTSVGKDVGFVTGSVDQPGTPTSANPGSTSSPGPTTGSSTVTVSWGASSGATSYGLGVRDVATGALVVDTTLTATSYTVTLSAGRPYRWNVAACNSAGCSSYTTPLYFQTPGSVTVPAMPTSASPGTTSSPGPTTESATVTVSWGASSGATSYGLGVRDVSTGTLVVDTTLTGTSYTVTLSAGRTYRWNVAACNSAGCSSYTTPLYFQTPGSVTVPAMPTSPSPGATSSPGPTTGSATVTVSWGASSGATSYGLGVRDVATGALVVDTTLTGTSHTVTLSAGRAYRWNVAACNIAGCSSYTTPLYFQTPGSVTVPGTPTSTSPGSTSSPGPTTGSATVTVRWGASSGATSYGLGVRDVATGALVVDTTLTGTSYTVTLSAGRPYRWNVAACSSAGCSSYTTPLYFQTPGSVTVPAMPTSTSPGTTSSPGPTMSSRTVTLAWTPPSGAVSYGLGVRDVTSGVLVVDTTTTSSSYTVTLSAGRTYRWNVAACNGAGCSSYTTPLYFQTPGSVTVPVTPTSASPGTTSSPGPTTGSATVTVSWGASSGATSYGLGVRDVATSALVVDTTLTGTSYTVTLSAGRTYRWNVAACNSAGCSSYTTPLHFQTPGSVMVPAMPTSTSPGTASSPGPTTATTTVTAGWAAASGATIYGLGVRDVASGVLVVDTATAATSYTVTLSAGRTYRWNVAACSSAGCSSYTTPLYFQTPGSVTVPAMPTSTSPGTTSSPGPTMSSRTVTLAWTPPSGAVSYGLGVRDVTSGVLMVDTTTTSSSYTVTLSAGRTYRWNVAACNGSGCSGYTTPVYFRTP